MVQIATLQFTIFEGTSNRCRLPRQCESQVMQPLGVVTARVRYVPSGSCYVPSGSFFVPHGQIK